MIEPTGVRTSSTGQQRVIEKQPPRERPEPAESDQQAQPEKAEPQNGRRVDTQA